MLISPEPVARTSHRLSKSRYLSGLQCHKRLYLDIHAPALATKPDAAMQAILDMGTDLGELARQRFPGGRLVKAGYRQSRDALEQTAALMQDPSVPAIFEGAFQFNHVLVRVDVLERIGVNEQGQSTWRLVEVKSSTKVKQTHLDDLTIQSYVLEGAGSLLADICLMHVNTQYLFDGRQLDLTQLLTLRSLNETVRPRLSEVPVRLAAMQAMLEELSAPAIVPDEHCHSPYECPFWAHCTQEKPSRWIYHLPGSSKTVIHLRELGVETIDDIPDHVALTPVQRRVKDNREWIGDGLRAALDQIVYPVHHLDFETFMPAVPKFVETRPYQVVPTQWSNHVEQNDGTLDHAEYLCRDGRDPREELTVTLLDSLGKEGSICVYSSYERSILERLIEEFPSLRKDLKRVIARLWDLHVVIRDHYYHPAFEGSYSIKAVLPALVPSLSYGDLAIQDGGTAAGEYHRMVFAVSDWIEKERIGEALLRYCERDTLAMVELRRELKKRAG
jgi:predicted RecB family nuclease